MEDISIIQEPVRTIYKNAGIKSFRPKLSTEAKTNKLVNNNLVQEIDENFRNYLNRHGLADEKNLLVLSSNLHYYYDYEELKEVKTLINLKKLNLVKHLDDFLHTLSNGLSPMTNFIGCFSDVKSQKGVSMISRLYKRLLNFVDSKFDIEISSRNFSRLLESHGFTVIDMTVIDGLTYFRTQNRRMTSV
jgi:hypothetical protein